MRNRKIKNNNMGFIPSTQDRSAYQRRSEYIESLSPIGKALVSDFEKLFIGNLVNGFSYSSILKSFIQDYKSMLFDRTIDLSHWFDTSPFVTIFGSSVTSSYNANQTISSDLKYKNLIRPDGKPSPIVLTLGRQNGMSFTENFLKLFSVVAKPLITSNASEHILGTTVSDNYPDGLFAPNKNFSIIGRTKNPAVVLFPFTNNSVQVNPFFMYYPNPLATTVNTEGSYGSRYTRTFSTGGIPLTLTVKLFSPNSFLAELNEALNVILWLESESVSLNLEGNTDGVKTDSFEQVLNDQLLFLNNLSDKVENSLIAEKAEGQARKDELLLKIDEGKINLQAAINDKRKNIATTKESESKLQTLIKNRIMI